MAISPRSRSMAIPRPKQSPNKSPAKQSPAKASPFTWMKCWSKSRARTPCRNSPNTCAGPAQVFGEFRHGVLARDFDQHFIHVNGLAFAGLCFAGLLFGLCFGLGMAIERDLGEIAIG